MRYALGRGFSPAEGLAGGPSVALIAHALCQRRFGSAREIVGGAISPDQERYTVIGILPPEYPFPFPGVDVWITRLMNYGGLQPEQIAQGAGYLRILARLTPGTTLAQARQEVQAIHTHYKAEHTPAMTRTKPTAPVRIMSVGRIPRVMLSYGSCSLKACCSSQRVLPWACFSPAGATATSNTLEFESTV